MYTYIYIYIHSKIPKKAFGGPGRPAHFARLCCALSRSKLLTRTHFKIFGNPRGTSSAHFHSNRVVAYPTSPPSLEKNSEKIV